VAPKSKTHFISGQSDLKSVRAAIHVGGSGYISKMEAAVELLAGIEAVVRGERFFSPGLADSDDVIDARESDSEDEKTTT
jgi:DNA-binding NarL/FixJ family response regulator